MTQDTWMRGQSFTAHLMAPRYALCGALLHGKMVLVADDDPTIRKCKRCLRARTEATR